MKPRHFRVAGMTLAAVGWLWWRPWSALVAVAPRLFCVARVALGDIHRRFVSQAWCLVTSTFVLCGWRGTYGTGLALVAALVGAGRCGAAPLLRGNVALGDIDRVALGDIYLQFVWQAWRLLHWAGSGGGLGRAPRLFSVARVALGDIDRRLVWQA
eukprot:s156_g7.t1